MDTAAGFAVERRDMKAEAMLMHRDRYVIAVRAAQGDAATVIQVSFIADSHLSDLDEMRTWSSSKGIFRLLTGVPLFYRSLI